MGIEIPENLPYLSRLAPEEWTELVERSKRRRYSNGSVVFHQGDDSLAGYLILNGKVKVVLQSGNGREIALNILKSGSYFGEISVFDEMPQPATVIAIEDSELLVMPRLVIIDQIKKNPQIAMELLSDVIGKLRRMHQRINDLAFLDVRQRVTKTLLNFPRETTSEITSDFIMIPRPPLKEIAAMSGTSRETVSRILSDFCKKNMIGMTRRNIIIYKMLEVGKDFM